VSVQIVIVIAGPIASGKSTVAKAVASEFESRGLPAAVIDLDLVYEMLEPDSREKGDQLVWRRARRAAGALTEAFLADDTSVVVVEGDFLDERGREEFLTFGQHGS